MSQPELRHDFSPGAAFVRRLQAYEDAIRAGRFSEADAAACDALTSAVQQALEEPSPTLLLQMEARAAKKPPTGKAPRGRTWSAIRNGVRCRRAFRCRPLVVGECQAPSWTWRFEWSSHRLGKGRGEPASCSRTATGNGTLYPERLSRGTSGSWSRFAVRWLPKRGSRAFDGEPDHPRTDRIAPNAMTRAGPDYLGPGSSWCVPESSAQRVVGMKSEINLRANVVYRTVAAGIGTIAFQDGASLRRRPPPRCRSGSQR